MTKQDLIAERDALRIKLQKETDRANAQHGKNTEVKLKAANRVQMYKNHNEKLESKIKELSEAKAFFKGKHKRAASIRTALMNFIDVWADKVADKSPELKETWLPWKAVIEEELQADSEKPND